MLAEERGNNKEANKQKYQISARCLIKRAHQLRHHDKRVSGERRVDVTSHCLIRLPSVDRISLFKRSVNLTSNQRTNSFTALLTFICGWSSPILCSTQFSTTLISVSIGTRFKGHQLKAERLDFYQLPLGVAGQ